MWFWAVPIALAAVMVGAMLFGALTGRGVPVALGMGSAVAAVVVTFLYITRETGASVAAWAVVALACAALVLLLVAVWWERWKPALGAATCLVAAGVLFFVIVAGPEETLPTDPHESAASRMVVLGDSYIAGEGAPSYFPGTDVLHVNRCHRAATAYPYLVADELDLSLTFAACSGAKTFHVTSTGQYPASKDVFGAKKQLDVLRESLDRTKLVLMSIGGNDAGFAEIGAACAAPGEPDCRRSANFWIKRLETRRAAVAARHLYAGAHGGGRDPGLRRDLPQPRRQGAVRLDRAQRR